MRHRPQPCRRPPRPRRRQSPPRSPNRNRWKNPPNRSPNSHPLRSASPNRSPRPSRARPWPLIRRSFAVPFPTA
ncbi:MAG: hypothetical protein F4Z80_06145 [Chloroflexi bacterium]|nr:hypothetical protein [Chloroflexota bacterium]MYC47115.1 hypothetical protein [Chloroflexota bacterium]